uniref:Putative secreted protein n=1 Tax=Ixodes ricinus TaxID=34613 RepID=A0A6B0UNP9_IXORI
MSAGCGWALASIAHAAASVNMFQRKLTYIDECVSLSLCEGRDPCRASGCLGSLPGVGGCRGSSRCLFGPAPGVGGCMGFFVALRLVAGGRWCFSGSRSGPPVLFGRRRVSCPRGTCFFARAP